MPEATITLRLRCGLDADLPAEAALAEPLYTTDAGELWIGNGVGNPLTGPFTVGGGGGGGGAPDNADYLVKTANGTLTAERVVGGTTTVVPDWSVAGAVSFYVPFLSLTDSHLAPESVTYPKIQNAAGAGVIGAMSAGPFSLLQAQDVLDQIGNVQGYILYRAASSWAVLAAGTAGRPLVTGGAGANPSWAQLGTAGLANNAATNAILDDMANGTVKGRKTAGTGDPEDLTLSEVLDLIGSAAQGDILYRGASAWARLPAGTDRQYVQTRGAGANPAYAQPGLRTVTVLTSGTGATYNTPAGCVAVKVYVLGGGGGGGGAGNTASQVAVGSGGAGGTLAVKLFAPAASSYTYTVGPGGTAAPAGNNAGGSGGNSSFGSAVGTGGPGGSGQASGTGAAWNLGATASALSASGDYVVTGNHGGNANRESGTVGISGAGGNSAMGHAGGQARNTAGAGVAGTDYGAGGSGGMSTGGSTQGGGAGSGGLIIVEEFY